MKLLPLRITNTVPNVANVNNPHSKRDLSKRRPLFFRNCFPQYYFLRNHVLIELLFLKRGVAICLLSCITDLAIHHFIHRMTDRLIHDLKRTRLHNLSLAINQISLQIESIGVVVDKDCGPLRIPLPLLEPVSGFHPPILSMLNAPSSLFLLFAVPEDIHIPS